MIGDNKMTDIQMMVIKIIVAVVIVFSITATITYFYWKKYIEKIVKRYKK